MTTATGLFMVFKVTMPLITGVFKRPVQSVGLLVSNLLVHEARNGDNRPLHYTTLNMIFGCLIILSVITTLSCLILIFNSLMISVRHECTATFHVATSFLLLSLLVFFHIFTNTKFVHVTSTYYHS